MIKYIEYIEVPSQTRVAWDTGVKITSLDDEVYLDFMPLEGQGTDDNWYAYVCDSENNIVIRSGSNIPQTQIGVSFGNFRTYIDRQTVVLANKNERNVLYLSKSSFQNLTSGTSIQLSATELRSVGSNIGLNCGGMNNGTPTRCMTAKYYGFKIVNGNTAKLDLKPCLDGSDNPCFYDEVSQTYIYHIGSGTPIAGPVLYTFNVTPSTLSFNASGGTSTITVNAETGWTCTTPTGFTLSTTAGTSGETTINVTAPDYTGSTKKSEVITFTDDNGYTNEATLKQKAYSTGGLYNCFLGDTEGTFYLGGLEVSNMYLGEIEVYASGPYIGLKLSPSTIQFSQDSGLTSSMKVKSSEAWTLALPNDATWLSASTLSGFSGETTVTLSTTEENTGETRTAVITATTTSFSATCTVNQNVTHYVSWISNNPISEVPLFGTLTKYINLNINPTEKTKIRFKGYFQGLTNSINVMGNLNSSNPQMSLFWYNGGQIYFDYAGGRINTSFTKSSGDFIDFTIENYKVYDNVEQTYVMTGTTKSQFTATQPILADVQTWRLTSVEIWEGETKVFDGKAAIDDGTGNIGLYDTVSGTLFYNPNLSMTYGE